MEKVHMLATSPYSFLLRNNLASQGIYSQKGTCELIKKIQIIKTFFETGRFRIK